MASIQRRPNGMWRARYRDPITGKEYARHFEYRNPDKKDPPSKGRKPGDSAQEWLDSKTAEIVNGEHVDPRNARTPLRDYFTSWSARQVWADGTSTAMSLAIRTCSFADVPLGSIQRSHVEAWVKAMDTAGLAPGTIRTRLNNVRSVLRAAVRDRLISRDPSDGVVPPRQRRAEAAMKIPTPAQVGKLLEHADEAFRVYLSLAAFAGLRLGEISALQVGDIGFLERQLKVQRQVQRAGAGQVKITPPKYGSERTVALPDDVIALLAIHVQGLPEIAPNTGLFSAENGLPPHQNTIGHRWRQTTRRAEVTGFTLHDLRHFFASGLIASGCDVVTVQRALGHAKATTTLNTYAHLWPTAEDRTRAAAGELYKAATSGAQLRSDQLSADWMRTQG